MCLFEAVFGQKIFDGRFLHDRVADCRVLSAKISGFCRATFFVKETFFSDHSKVEKKPREASEAFEADEKSWKMPSWTPTSSPSAFEADEKSWKMPS